ncbi:MAG: PilZ domain-containing protein [Planctomycetes bacterium]|nr:PilZ domain-containing protein [Planctomycetota bacterium]
MHDEKTSIEIIEKRRFLRLNDYFRVSFQPAGEFGEESAAASREDVGFSKNLSLGGVAFVTGSNVQISDYIRAEIQIPEIETPIEIVGQVIRVTPLEGGRREVAIKFLPFGIDEEQRGKLELFIYDHFLQDPLG